MLDQKIFLRQCQTLLEAYKEGKLGYMKMPEDEQPDRRPDQESRLVYFTLPMSLNYQRNSYTLRESVLQTRNDPAARDVFAINNSALMPEEMLRQKLLAHKIALQPNKHVATRQKIAQTVSENRGSLTGLFEAAKYDFLELRHIIQVTHKKGFPYLSGPKIFNYWAFIIQSYGGISLSNSERIEIAPDTHITQCSVKLWLITEDEAELLSKDHLSALRREALSDSGINPIQMHPPLWFWSRNKFIFSLTE